MADHETSSTTSGPSNKKLNQTLNKLLGGIGEAYSDGPSVYKKSTYVGPSSTTRNAWAMSTGAAGNPDYAAGVGGALDSFSRVARGDYLDNVDPEYQALVDRSANETAADINASMGADGRYGSNVHVNALGDAIGDLRTKAAVDNRRYEIDRQSEAAAMLPQLFAANRLPSSVYGAVGAAQDADASAKRLGEKDLFERRGNADVDLLARLSAILGGTAGVSPTTTTTTQPTTPWWQTALGLGVGALSLA